ncbi:dihydroorotate dehydrogenase (quinone), mitochondrial-like isoform X2 [Macrobrachium nipponense]|uniref:dihydroorotate dehydrogenase (quinone), mitochondrial-like isoform X2 n=1 Tax=Macrobrachium nipponense TaxID=159736 RepID=UPI0030C8CC7B
MASKYLKSSVLRKRLMDVLKLTVGGGVTFVGINIYMQNEKFYETWVMPVFRRLDPETAHNMAVMAAKYHLVPKTKIKDSKLLESQVFDMKFKTPIGLAAGFDKNGEAVEGLFKMGFSFVEVGSITPLPQPGNPKPRVFRLPEDKGIINRYGFNSEGHDAVYERLSQLPPPGMRQGVLGINLGKNKTSDDPLEDYCLGIKKFGLIADYLVVNISSPNTPGLRALQNREQLEKLLNAVVEAKDSLPEGHRPPILIKIAPDLTEEDKYDIANVILSKKQHISGLIISNTTVTRPSTLQCEEKKEVGGLSGEPLKSLATNTIRDIYHLTDGCLPIIGVGGISSGEDAYEKICAGASLVQLYSGLIYHGPPLVKKITDELDELLRDGFSSVKEAVGSDKVLNSDKEVPTSDA